MQHMMLTVITSYDGVGGDGVGDGDEDGGGRHDGDDDCADAAGGDYDEDAEW